MKIVVAHSGARDGYQAAAALAEAGRLDALVTDLYWARSHWLARGIDQILNRFSPELIRALRVRHEPALDFSPIEQCFITGALTLAIRKTKAPFAWSRWATRAGDARIGKRAGRLARRNGSALLSYSYYGHSAFCEAGDTVPRILFQLHPHPLSVRRVLTRELERFPQCAASLRKEWELALPEKDFQTLVAESRMPGHWIAASSFTRQTLIEHGAAPERIHVAPYGADLQRFSAKRDDSVPLKSPLRLLFVGTITQRKGIYYLLKALELLKTKHLRLIVCGRVVDDLALFQPYRERVEVRASVGAGQLAAAYHCADLFVLPSLAEGFGHVLLEAMASGLPVLSTTHTAAPDLIDSGGQGFVVEPGSADVLAERIDWALSHRRELRAMGQAARRRAELFTWERFRARIREIVESVLCDRVGPRGDSIETAVVR